MAIQSIKNIINNKGYVVNSKDRAIFEQGNLQSFFGFGEKDAIEFIVYDINNNQLPQKNGELVRYVNLTTQNISDYFMIAEGTILTKHKLPNEYFIDVERLLSEAGYTNGIFKTQITLINKKVGNEKLNEKLWISEISPSRTEVRLFPIKNEITANTDLQERFNLFVNNSEFRDDTINLAFNFIEKITPNKISSFMKDKYGVNWVNKLKTEFKINDLDNLSTKIYNKFSEACFYNFTNRISDVNSLNYGKPNTTTPPIKFSVDEIKSVCRTILVTVINYYLYRQDIHTTTTYDSANLASLDEVGQILQKLESNTIIDTSSPVLQTAVIQKPFQSETDINFNNEIIKITDPIQTPVVIAVPDDFPYKIPTPTPRTGGGGNNGGTHNTIARGEFNYGQMNNTMDIQALK
jgi:hypothetical protein